jgi:hypothetical protein
MPPELCSKDEVEEQQQVAVVVGVQEEQHQTTSFHHHCSHHFQWEPLHLLLLPHGRAAGTPGYGEGWRGGVCSLLFMILHPRGCQLGIQQCLQGNANSILELPNFFGTFAISLILFCQVWVLHEDHMCIIP